MRRYAGCASPDHESHGIDRAWNPAIDSMRSAPGVTLVALFSPEHGIRGTVDAKVGDSLDP